MSEPMCNKTCPAWDVCLSPGAAEYEGCSRPELRALAESEARLRKGIDDALVALNHPAINRRHNGVFFIDTDGSKECICWGCTAKSILEAARAGEGK